MAFLFAALACSSDGTATSTTGDCDALAKKCPLCTSPQLEATCQAAVDSHDPASCRDGLADPDVKSLCVASSVTDASTDSSTDSPTPVDASMPDAPSVGDDGGGCGSGLALPSSQCPVGSCPQTCSSGQTCNFDCAGGKCAQTCQPGANCTLSCSGGACAQNCAAGSNCSVTCNGGGCSRVGTPCAKTCTGGGCNG